SEWVVFGKGYDKVQAFQSQLTNFARAVRGEEKLLITSEDALASVEVVAAAYRSMRKTTWTTVPLNGAAMAMPAAVASGRGQACPPAPPPPRSSNPVLSWATGAPSGTTSTSATAPAWASSASSARRPTSLTTP